MNFENLFRFFIDQIFGGSKSDWIFLKRFIGADCRNRRPMLQDFSLQGLGGTWEGGGDALYMEWGWATPHGLKPPLVDTFG